MIKSKASKYIEKEATHSGDEESEGEMSDASNDTYEKNSFIADSDEEPSGDEDAVQALRAKQAKKKADEEQLEIMQELSKLRKKPATASGSNASSSNTEKSATQAGAQAQAGCEAKAADQQAKRKREEDQNEPAKKVHKPQGNKSLDMKHVPAEPKTKQSQPSKSKANFHYAIRFTNARHAQSFWEVASKALPYLFFHLEVTENYSGLRLEAHDTPPTMAIKSRMECIIQEGVDQFGKPVDRLSLNGEIFCVNSKNLLKCFKCAQVKDTPLTLKKWHNKDGIIFEAFTNEEDVKTEYMLPFYTKTPSTVLQRIPTTSDMQVKMATHVLQKLATISSTLGATLLRFDLFEAESEATDVTRYKLIVFFTGSEIPGGHTFYLGAKKTNVKGIEEFEPIVTSAQEQEAFKWNLVSSNSYNSNKFKLFVSNLDNEWCFVGVSTDERSKPIIIVADSTETGTTSHTIIISPQQPDDEE